MTLSIYQVDAFTSQLFGGNPAAVIPLDTWPEDGKMQQIAMENNLSETAFLLKKKMVLQLGGLRPSMKLTCAGMPHWQALL